MNEMETAIITVPTETKSNSAGFRLATDPEPIRQKIREAHSFALESRSAVNAAIVAAWEAGAMFRRVQSFLGPRKFLPWFRQEFGGSLGESTVFAYMRLSRSNVRVIERCNSLRQAFILLGMVTPDERPAVTDTGAVDVFKLLRHRVIKPMMRLRTLLEVVPLDEIPEDELDKLRLELEPMETVLVKLGWTRAEL